MTHRFLFRRRVEFADTDVAGIMHFSNFFRFMEVTEHAFYRSLGFSVHPFSPDAGNPDVNPVASGDEVGTTVAPGVAVGGGDARVGWPRVHASADFRLPLHFEEEVEIELLVEEVRNRTIRYFFRFWKNPDSPEGKAEAAVGRFTVVCVCFDADTRRMKAVAIPDEWREKIASAPEGAIPSGSDR
ncbi:MAG: thioesterase family protein [Verrucomicrobiales bacterium]